MRAPPRSETFLEPAREVPVEPAPGFGGATSETVAPAPEIAPAVVLHVYGGTPPDAASVIPAPAQSKSLLFAWMLGDAPVHGSTGTH